MKTTLFAKIAAASSIAAAIPACHPGSPPPPGNQPALIAIYCFNAGEFTGPQSTIMVTFTGQGPASGTFSVTGNATVTPGDPHSCVSATVAAPLAPGQWTVRATPNAFGAPLTCRATVPGTVTLDVSGTTPTCR